MWNLKHFGQTYRCTGTISAAVGQLGLNVDGNDPYVNGDKGNMNVTPRDGADVTFRPRIAGKAK